MPERPPAAQSQVNAALDSRQFEHGWRTARTTRLVAEILNLDKLISVSSESKYFAFLMFQYELMAIPRMAPPLKWSARILVARRAF